MGNEIIPQPTAGERKFLLALKAFSIGCIITMLTFGLIYYKTYQEVKRLQKQVEILKEGVTYLTYQDPQTGQKTRYVLMALAKTGENSSVQPYIPLFLNEEGYQNYYNSLRLQYLKHMEAVKNGQNSEETIGEDEELN